MTLSIEREVNMHRGNSSSFGFISAGALALCISITLPSYAGNEANPDAIGRAASILSSLLLCSLALHGAEVASSVPSASGLDTLTPKGNADGIVLFDFETEAEHEAVRASNTDYGNLITVTNRMAASGDFALHVSGMGDTEDAKTGYYRLKFADTYYGEMTHYGLYRLAWADVRRTRN